MNTNDVSDGVKVDFTKEVVCLELGTSVLGTMRTVREDVEMEDRAIQVSKEVEERFVKSLKSIIDSSTLNQIKKVCTSARTYLDSRALKTGVFRHGIYVIPLALVPEVDKKLSEFIEIFNQLVDQFVAEYPQLITIARQNLGPLFKADDYLSTDTVRNAFGITTSYITLQVPASLQGLSKEIYEREQMKAEERWREAENEVRDALRVAFVEMVDHLTDRLSVNEDGKPKRFHVTSLEKLQDFLTVFEKRNVTQDADLQELVTKARSVVAGLDPAKVRKDVDLRARLRDSLVGLATSSKVLTEEIGSRRIKLRGLKLATEDQAAA